MENIVQSVMDSCVKITSDGTAVFERNNCCNSYCNTVRLPIRMIENINVKVFLRAYGGTINLDINSKCGEVLFVKKYSRNKDLDIKQDITNIVSNIFDTIKKLRFCRFIGKLTTDNIEELNTFNTEYIEVFKNLMLENNNIVLSFGECCVCNENTKTYLKCGCVNNICFECYSRLKIVEEKDYELDEFKDMISCPLCRKSLDIQADIFAFE
jgi:hypothetical protein